MRTGRNGFDPSKMEDCASRVGRFPIAREEEDMGNKWL
jgi:hypothetical protein